MPEKKPKTDIDTQVVHAGEHKPTPPGQPTSMPIYSSVTYTYDSVAEMDRVFAGQAPGYLYTRHGNPTTDALGDVLCEIEGGATACVYASGMAALHAAFLTSGVSAGTTVLASQDLYGATTGLLHAIFGTLGVKTVTADFADLDQVRALAKETKPRVLLAETISNPLLKVCDIDTCAEIAREAGARLIIDNTFASPYLCQPLKHGADIVVHSATKFLGGHADAMGGVAISRDEADGDSLVRVMKYVGGVLSPWDAHEILRGIKTLAVRMERHCENASAVAAWLNKDARVARVHYPGTQGTNASGVQDAGGSADRGIATRMLRTPYFGALVSIELKDNSREAAFRFMDALKLCVRSTSLGDVFTSVLHPATASHRDLDPARRDALGITDGLIRMSVGIENANDIIADIEQALNAVSPEAAAVSVPGAVATGS
ncbi:MAG TPA: PLP-dependent aspartate aminotransferase family protein [Pyrinomonadaceae bacterium]|nr:PLP-dependent aspartate aminotransferase family protein [Pyrinomonadaceae bacterium]